MHTNGFLRTHPRWWVVAATLAGASFQSGEPPACGATADRIAEQAPAAAREPQEPSSALSVTGPPVAPRPAADRRREWAPALTKPAPTSIADLKTIEQRVKALVEQVSPAVVAVSVGFGSGSGVVISADGLVLTAGHVCGRADRPVRFTFPDGKVARGRTLGMDSDTDCGLMRITDRGPWPHAATGDLQQARAGDWVLALGHPGGFDLKRSLVVRLGRIIRFTPEALQTDCTITSGDSGGPLFDMQGRVIGIHTAISGSPAQNYHVAITSYCETWDQLAQGGSSSTRPTPPQAYVGAAGVDGAPGCRLTSIDRNSPAARAGLKVGDLVLKVDNREITASASFLRWVAEATPGETLNLEIQRGDQLLTLNVKLESLPRSR